MKGKYKLFHKKILVLYLNISKLIIVHPKLIHKLTDNEFAILDELYFISTIEMLLPATKLNIEQLKAEMCTLFQKGYIKIYSQNEEIDITEEKLLSNFETYQYIASKKGLLAHNTL